MNGQEGDEENLVLGAVQGCREKQVLLWVTGSPAKSFRSGLKEPTEEIQGFSGYADNLAEPVDDPP
jgi:hypothetical protein